MANDFESELFFEKMRFCLKFWKNELEPLIKKYSVQNAFAPADHDFTYEEITAYLRNSFSSICDRFGLSFHENIVPYKTEFVLVFCNNHIPFELGNRISITVYVNDIYLRIMPSQFFHKTFRIEEYPQIENIVAELCEDLVTNEKFDLFVIDYSKFKESLNIITPKTLEIAMNSIKALYEKSNLLNPVITQHRMYSTMLINNKTVNIFHKDYLENPDILLRLLNEKTL